MSRPTCYRCFWPQRLCWCASIRPMTTATRFLFLMHPKEWKQEKAATGRLTHLCLADSVLHAGVEFDQHEEVQALLRDPALAPHLLYPGEEALNLSRPDSLPQLHGRQLLVVVLDATWALARKMLRLSPSLQRLPRIMFTPEHASRYIIKQQPHPACLSTLEATHELLLALERRGLDRYQDPSQLLSLFARMQDFQMRCAADPTLGGYRRRPYGSPPDRTPPTGRSGARRTRLFGRAKPSQPSGDA